MPYGQSAKTPNGLRQGNGRVTCWLYAAVLAVICTQTTVEINNQPEKHILTTFSA